MARIVVGLSGGVDSSVAALLLKQQGHEVHGVFMDNWDAADAYCTSAQDFQDARQVASALDIPLHKVSFADEYLERVFALFLAELRAGRTPNPDVLCNSEIKFRCFLDYALRLGADRIATGHYARADHGGARPRLLRAADRDKDQCYFLHAIEPEALARAEFPLGGLQKSAVRDLAFRAGFATHDKPDSTGICFIGERRFREFLRGHLAARPGPIVDADGTTLGAHDGLAGYTLGQRAGLHIGGRRGSAELPWYVAAKDLARDALVVVQGHDHPLLLSVALEVEQLRWLGPAAADGEALTAQLRHRQTEQACRVQLGRDHCARVVFAAPQRAVTPGQYCVLFRGDECIGGGVIAGAVAAVAVQVAS
jgi:tRNA-specific 2-thiouridylase